MSISYQEHLMDYFRRNQDKILNPEQEGSLAQIIKPIACKRTPKSDGMYDILISFQEKHFIIKHVKPAPINHLLPLDFSEAFVLDYKGDEHVFLKEIHVLKDEHIEKDFNYELTNPEQMDMIAFAIMTSFPFMDQLTKKIQAHLMKVERNEPCPCESGKKYKNCCMK